MVACPVCCQTAESIDARFAFVHPSLCTRMGHVPSATSSILCRCALCLVVLKLVASNYQRDLVRRAVVNTPPPRKAFHKRGGLRRNVCFAGLELKALLCFRCCRSYISFLLSQIAFLLPFRSNPFILVYPFYFYFFFFPTFVDSLLHVISTFWMWVLACVCACVHAC